MSFHLAGVMSYWRSMVEGYGVKIFLESLYGIALCKCLVAVQSCRVTLDFLVDFFTFLFFH